MSEIEKLRLENDKLRKQTEASSTQLKKQIEEDKPKSKKRKASLYSQQISPPSTPEQQQQQRKKKMLKQTKSPLVVKNEQTLLDGPTSSSPWTPLLDNTLNSYPSSSPPNYFDMTAEPYTTSPSNQQNNLLFMTPAIDIYNNNNMSGGQYHNMMNPMLLSPYFVPTNENTTDGKHLYIIFIIENNINLLLACYYQNQPDNFYLPS